MTQSTSTLGLWLELPSGVKTQFFFWDIIKEKGFVLEIIW
jgi:hypothetical protein